MNDTSTTDPRREAHERLHGRFEVRVLEPSPPAETEEPWFADDPVAVGDVPPDATIVTPVPATGITWDALSRREPDLADWCARRWLGAWRPLPSVDDADALASTRLSWHALAEQVLAPARRRANGKIGLRYTRLGFGTPFYGADEQVRVAGRELVIVRDGRATAHPITTVRAAAEVVGVEPGAPADLYPPGTPFEPDATLAIDPAAAALLGDWFGFACSVLEVLRAGASAVDQPARVQLWPEHFDLSVDLGPDADGGRGTYGASPGDAAHPEPYLYVTPWQEVPDDPVWNDTAFRGASLPLSAFATSTRQRAIALTFFARVQAALRGPAVGTNGAPR